MKTYYRTLEKVANEKKLRGRTRWTFRRRKECWEAMLVSKDGITKQGQIWLIRL